MKNIFFAFGLLFSFTTSWAEGSACLPTLVPSICKDSSEKLVLNRCSNDRGCYNLYDNGANLRCCPVVATNESAKSSFVDLVKISNQENLTRFKQSCNFSSPMNYLGNRDLQNAIQDVIRMGEVYSIRAIIYSESHCVNINNHENILSLLGNEILIAHPAQLIQAFSDEEKNMHLKEIAQMETNEWRKFKCKTDSCWLNRNTYFASKLTALQNAKVPSNLEPLRQDIIQSVKSVTNVGKQSFLKLAEKPTETHLRAFKETCNITSPVDFINDEEVHQAIEKLFKVGNVYAVRALMYAEPHCADIENRKMILSWLGNEILISSPATLLMALKYEDKKHELFDIAEIENKQWREQECSGPPCSDDRKAYFASKRKALTEAKIDKSLEPYRRMLLNGLKSDL